MYASRLWSGCRGAKAMEERGADDVLHDFDRPACDLDDACVRVGPRNRVFPHVAPAAEQLQTLVHHLAVQVREPHFCHGDVYLIECTSHEALDALVGEDPPDGRLGLELSELELGILKIRDGLAERLALRDVVHRPLDDG